MKRVTYVVAPKDSRIVRTANTRACPGTRRESGDATEAVKVLDTLENGINLGRAKVIAEFNLAASQRHGPRILGRGGDGSAGDCGKLEGGIDSDGLGDHLLHGAVEGLDHARRDLNLPRLGDNCVAGDAVRVGSERAPDEQERCSKNSREVHVDGTFWPKPRGTV